MLNNGKVMSFQDLKDKFELYNQDFFRYLQIRDFLNKKLKQLQLYTRNEEIIDIFKNAYKDASYQKKISKIYQTLSNLKRNNTLHMKARWESEGNLTLTTEEWDRICTQQWSATSAPSWKEFSWKNMARYCCTPEQKTKYSHQTSCWRLCGHTLANHFHIFGIVPLWLHFGKKFTRFWKQSCKGKYNFILYYCT